MTGDGAAAEGTTGDGAGFEGALLATTGDGAADGAAGDGVVGAELRMAIKDVVVDSSTNVVDDGVDEVGATDDEVASTTTLAATD